MTSVRLPGDRLLRLGRVLCSEEAFGAIVEPMIADLQADYLATPFGPRRLWRLLRARLAVWRTLLHCVRTAEPDTSVAIARDRIMETVSLLPIWLALSVIGGGKPGRPLWSSAYGLLRCFTFSSVGLGITILLANPDLRARDAWRRGRLAMANAMVGGVLGLWLKAIAQWEIVVVTAVATSLALVLRSMTLLARSDYGPKAPWRDHLSLADREK